jgi:hypothetical protein
MVSKEQFAHITHPMLRAIVVNCLYNPPVVSGSPAGKGFSIHKGVFTMQR